MKTSIYHHLAIALGFMLGTGAFAQTFTNLDVSNQATIAGAAFFGQIQLGSTAGSTSPGASLHVTQTTQTVYGSSTIAAHFEDNWVTVEEWGTVYDPGYWTPMYSWGVVGQDYYPAVYDAEGNLLVEEHWEDRYGDVYQSSYWTEGTSRWAITGTHEENQPTWVPDQQVPYSTEQYNAPVIHLSALRSDANWVWDVPDSSGNGRPVMRLWDGGLTLPKADGGVEMTLAPSSLSYFRSGFVAGADSSSTTTEINSDSTTHVTSITASGQWAESKSEVRPELIRLTRSESSGSTTTVGQTQIAAKSAAFGGVVEVAGDLKVKGTLRVKEQGDLLMGEFVQGPKPE